MRRRPAGGCRLRPPVPPQAARLPAVGRRLRARGQPLSVRSEPPQQVIGERLPTRRLPADQQQRVVPGNGAENVMQLGLIDGGSQELRRPRRRPEHHEIRGRLRGDQQLLREPPHPLLLGRLPQRRTRRAEPALARHGVDQIPVVVADLHRVQLVEVAGERRLGDAQPVVGEQLRELALRPHRLPVEDVHDPAVPRGTGLRHGRPGLAGLPRRTPLVLLLAHRRLILRIVLPHPRVRRRPGCRAAPRGTRPPRRPRGSAAA
ncbi:hypothetical protein SUDANB21_01140 [Streptomyces sp. enrichment culture]